MTPLEIMAKAHWADSENTAWENLLPQDRAHMIGVMRAALLALAEAELQPTIKAAGGSNWKQSGEEEFKWVLRAIATEHRP